ncbi:Cystathionine beta-lyase PatB [Tepidanaerobacter acetatoxydans Re1]|uniref:cysteine-S-conjugate beta-lyase n=1 Tax=Tepidanaerobacter acetatoxydans (strain DSM 21804 / JCM 16047 / Re1) TaxID=1209989 RepID=F4LQZ6_TEPAE|nr:MalY/PatB family protein [Tepidanaerobacter acetatoxydans]AEE92149.1 Cystathionine beta-lyase [Tepidanaerobacter acetatoxydans Re1]CDI40913.1 Cystathionine beta-lyase PatB [Tepidanaerobacter acetatoxydans Re1]
MQKYDFDTVIDRSGNYSSKWDELKKMFGRDDLLPMWVADMDFMSPQPVVDALVKRAKQGIYGYTSRPESYFESVARWMKKRHNWDVKTEWMIYTPGVVPALSFIINAFTYPGDKVLVQQPVYYPFFRVIEDNGRRIVNNPLIYKEGRYTMDFDDLEEKVKDRRIKLMFLCSPHNPVGRVWTKDELIRLGRICIDNNILVVSDEIHHDILYPGVKHIPFASISEEFALSSITCTAPSKTFNLAGLQTSTIIIPNTAYYDIYRNFIKRLQLLRNNAFGLVALEAAYTHGEEWLDQLLEYLDGNLRAFTEGIEKDVPQIKVVKPEGTYLVWLDCRELGFDAHQLNDFIIDKAKLAFESGYWFGHGGEGFQRTNIACPRTYVNEAVKRLKSAVESIK